MAYVFWVSNYVRSNCNNIHESIARIYGFSTDVGYGSRISGLSFYFLSLSLHTVPLGLAYSIWAGLGIVLVSLSGYFIYQQQLDWQAILGISMIIGGVIVIKFFSSVA